MRPLSRTQAQVKLRKLKDDLRERVAAEYEHRAKSCDICDMKGACCQDAHFVNVRVSPLEGEAIRNAVEDLSPIQRAGVAARTSDAIERYGLDGSGAARTYACPLFDHHAGCLVHEKAKPLPCIIHACYERSEDVPPDSLLAEEELAVEKLNVRTFGRSQPWLPIPIAILN
jgi:hypothetical protein